MKRSWVPTRCIAIFCLSGAQTENSQSPSARRLAPKGTRLSKLIELILYCYRKLIHSDGNTRSVFACLLILCDFHLRTSRKGAKGINRSDCGKCDGCGI